MAGKHCYSQDIRHYQTLISLKKVIIIKHIILKLIRDYSIIRFANLAHTFK